MSKSSALLHCLKLSSETLVDQLSKSQYTPPAGANFSVKSLLLSPLQSSKANLSDQAPEAFRPLIRDLILCVAALLSSSDSTSEHLSWIPNSVSSAASYAFSEISNAYRDSFDGGKELIKMGDVELEVDVKFVSSEKRLLIEFIPLILPLLKDKIKESSIDTSNDISAASAGVPAAYAIVAAHQLRWIVAEVDYPYLGKLCSLVIPCALTALDHWSPQVKGQGMVSFIHLARNVNAAEIGWYEDVILDACCQNVASSDEIWDYVVEMSVLLVTFTQRSNPRSSWYEKLLNDMLSHLERQPRNKERRVVWLKHIDPFLHGIGLILVAHFRRIFPLFFRWMHADDNETVILVLERIRTILKLTWIRQSAYIERLVDELVILYKESALKISRDDIRALCRNILILIQQSKGSQFEAVWSKHGEDPNMPEFRELFTGKITVS